LATASRRILPTAAFGFATNRAIRVVVTEGTEVGPAAGAGDIDPAPAQHLLTAAISAVTNG
jgi:hypothetical protein